MATKANLIKVYIIHIEGTAGTLVEVRLFTNSMSAQDFVTKYNKIVVEYHNREGQWPSDFLFANTYLHPYVKKTTRVFETT